MSLMSAAAIGIYCLVVLACLAAANVARHFPDRPGDKWHWLAAGGVFIGLAVVRLFNVEERFRSLARGATMADGDYSERLTVQVPLAIAALIIALVVVWIFARKWQGMRRRSRARLVLAARFGLLALVPLYALRLISLHQTDWLIYSGPVRINWLLEAAICLTVGGAGALYGWTKRPIRQIQLNRD